MRGMAIDAKSASELDGIVQQNRTVMVASSLVVYAIVHRTRCRTCSMAVTAFSERIVFPT